MLVVAGIFILILVAIMLKVRYDHKKIMALVASDNLRNQGIAVTIISRSTENLSQEPGLQIIEETSSTNSSTDEKLTADAICSNEKKSTTDSSSDFSIDGEKFDEPYFSMATMSMLILIFLSSY